MGEKHQHRQRQKRWYAYVYGNPLDPENYQTSTIYANCFSGSAICAIYSEGFDDQPFEFSNKMKTNIANALVSGNPQPPTGNPYTVILKDHR